MRTLRTQITILFTTFLVVALILFTLFFNGAVDKLFEMYANEQRQKQVQQIQEQINEQYSPLWGYNVSGLEVIGNAALHKVMEKKIDLVRKYDKKTNDICDGQMPYS